MSKISKSMLQIESLITICTYLKKISQQRNNFQSMLFKDYVCFGSKNLLFKAGHLWQLSRQKDTVLWPKKLLLFAWRYNVAATLFWDRIKLFFAFHKNPKTLLRCRCCDAKQMSHSQLCSYFCYNSKAIFLQVLSMLCCLPC